MDASGVHSKLRKLTGGQNRLMEEFGGGQHNSNSDTDVNIRSYSPVMNPEQLKSYSDNYLSHALSNTCNQDDTYGQYEYDYSDINFARNDHSQGSQNKKHKLHY